MKDTWVTHHSHGEILTSDRSRRSNYGQWPRERAWGLPFCSARFHPGRQVSLLQTCVRKGDFTLGESRARVLRWGNSTPRVKGEVSYLNRRLWKVCSDSICLYMRREINLFWILIYKEFFSWNFKKSSVSLKWKM